MPRRGLRTSLALAVSPLLLVAACGDSDEGAPTSPEDALAEAKANLDDTSGLTLELSTDSLPDGVDGILRASGVGTHAPAFDGDLEVSVSSLSLEVPVVAVDGLVYAKLPFTTQFKEIEPDDYGAPDPAALMDSTSGISSWLTAAEGVEEGEQKRDGDKVVTTYTGTLPGSAVVDVIPSASTKADFAATFSVDDDGFLTAAEVSGPFYGDTGVVDYTIALSDYGSDKDITRP